jgi:hypothetical protein
VLVDGHAAADDEVDRPHLADGDARGDTGRYRPVRRLDRWHGQVTRVEQVERLGRGELGRRHVEELSVLQGADADRQLRPVGRDFEYASLLPGREAGEPSGGLGGSVEGGDVAAYSGLGHAGLFEPGPDSFADGLLGLAGGGHAFMVAQPAMRVSSRS